MLRKVHNYWEFFYADEHGNQNNDYRRFNDESEACNYMFDKLIYEKEQQQMQEYEMSEILLSDKLPDNLTFPESSTLFFNTVKDKMNLQENL